jgi:glycosyltransferase involved in cell wall biosynthesis
MKPKISQHLTFLIFSAKGWGTGSALRAYYIAQALKKRGHQVQFVKPIPTLPLWLDMLLAAPYYLFRSLLTRAQVSLVVKPYPMVIPALAWQRLLGSKIVVDVDDLDFAYSRGHFRKFHEQLQKPWPRWADLVTYHNPKLRETLLDFFKVPATKMVQLPQGVDTELFNSNPVDLNNLPNRAKILLAGKKRPILTFTAHLNVACDLEPALVAFQSIHKSIPDAQLLVAGGGPEESRFKQTAQKLRISGAVHFTGYLSNRQVAACLKISSLILVYYKQVTANEYRASMKLREAAACGLPVVATGVGENINWKSFAAISQPDPIHFAETVLKTLKVKKKSKPSIQLLKRWDWTACVEALEKVLLKS